MLQEVNRYHQIVAFCELLPPHTRIECGVVTNQSPIGIHSIVPVFAWIPNNYGLVSIPNQCGGVQSKLVWYPHHRLVLVREPNQSRILVRYPIPVGMVSTSHLESQLVWYPHRISIMVWAPPHTYHPKPPSVVPNQLVWYPH
jgi:hypothetical protein